MSKLLTVIAVFACFFLSIVLWGWFLVYSPEMTFLCLLSLIVFSVINVFVGILHSSFRFYLKIAAVLLSFISLTLLGLFIFGFLCVIISQNDVAGNADTVHAAIENSTEAQHTTSKLFAAGEVPSYDGNTKLTTSDDQQQAFAQTFQSWRQQNAAR